MEHCGLWFFCSQAVGSCNLVLLVHQSKMGKTKSIQNSRIGAMPILQVTLVRRPGTTLVELELDREKHNNQRQGEHCGLWFFPRSCLVVHATWSVNENEKQKNNHLHEFGRSPFCR